MMKNKIGTGRHLGNQSGLTFIELMVVMVILGLFGLIAYQNFFPKVDTAKIQTARSQMEILALALDTYRLDVGVYPDSLEELLQSSVERWNGPYLKKKSLPKDPWREDYVYNTLEEGTAFDLYSTQGGKEEIHYDE